MPITRRRFVGLCLGSVGALAGAEALAFAGTSPLLRPPLAIDEGAFISKCLRCYRCISICPTGVIEPAVVEDGLLEIKTPKLNFHQGYCDFCNKCVDVCPTGALVPADPENPAQGRIGHAVVDPDRCLAFYNGCDQCVQRCPYGAITANEFGQPVVDESICNGCGVCVYICPALIYRSYGGSDTRGIEVVVDASSAEG